MHELVVFIMHLPNHRPLGKNQAPEHHDERSDDGQTSIGYREQFHDSSCPAFSNRCAI